jgi:hypothetical protein
VESGREGTMGAHCWVGVQASGRSGRRGTGAACRISHPKGRQSVALNWTAIAKSPKILEQFMKVDSLEQFRFSTHFAPDDLLPRDALEELARNYLFRRR